jgi:hypothetical protein
MSLMTRRLMFAALAIAGACSALICAQQPRQPRDGLRQPVYRVGEAQPARAQSLAQRPAGPQRELPVAAPADEDAPQTAEAAEGGHPLAPFVAKAEDLLIGMQGKVKDYSATLVKHERVGGVLMDPQHIAIKVRQEQKTDRGEVTVPFSVYLNFVAPDAIKGREVLWVRGRNEGKLTAHDGGTGLIAAIRSSVTVNLDPTSARAMEGNKYPITDIGMENLLRKLITVAREDMKHGEVEVKTFTNTKINGRSCTCLQSVHPVKRPHFRFHIARVYVDDELQLPVRYESHDWPRAEGEKPALLEEYTYLNVKLNNGFTDRDFDRANPEYNFN